MTDQERSEEAFEKFQKFKRPDLPARPGANSKGPWSTRLEIASRLMAARYGTGGFSLDFWRKAAEVIPFGGVHSTHEIYQESEATRRDLAMKLMAREALDLADTLMREEKASRVGE